MSKSPRCCLQISFNHGVAECPLQFGDENFLLWKMVLHTEWRWILNATGDFPCPFPSGYMKAMGASQAGVTDEIRKAPWYLWSDSHSEHVTWKSCTKATEQLCRDHTGGQSGACWDKYSKSSCLSLSPILSSSACSHSVLLFIGVGVNSAVPSSLSMSFRTGKIVCPHRVWVSSSSPPYSWIHGSRASLGQSRKAIWTPCFFVEVAKFYLMTVSNVSCFLCLICLFLLTSKCHGTTQ